MAKVPAIKLNQPLRVVIPIVAGIGNALMAVPMVRQIKRFRPDSRITLLARSGAMGEVFLRQPAVDQTLITGAGIRGIVRSIAWAQNANCYLVPFPSNRWQYNMLATASGRRHRILHGYPVGRISAMGFLPHHRVPARRGIHDVLQNLNLLRAFGIEPDETDRPDFPVTSDELARAGQMLADIGVGPAETPIIVHAGSAQTILAEAKRWPVARYARLIIEMSKRYGLPVVVIEGPDEAGVAEQILAQTRGVRVLGLRLAGGLGEAAGVLSLGKCYVGTDSGLAHLSAAVGKRAVTLFAPADPDRVCPYGNRDLVVQVHKDCSPCFLYPWKSTHPKMRCTEPFCITEITVEQVMEKVDRAIQS